MDIFSLLKEYVGFLILIAGAIYFILPRIQSKYFKRPILVMEIDPKLGITHGRQHQSFSRDNPPDRPVNDPETVSMYKLHWNFILTIRNNSEVTAYNIKLLKKGVGNFLKFDGNVNANKPLPKHNEISIPIEFEVWKESKHKDVEKLSPPVPPEFEELELLLTYENSQKTKFSSIFTFQNKTIRYEREIKQKDLKQWT